MIKLRNLQRFNYPLIIGGILLFLLLLVSIFPDQLATADPYGKQRMEFHSSETGESTFVIPPIPPSKEYPWGTDHLGRDLKSLIIYGCKVTMIVAILSALGRLLIALPLAIAAAYKNKFSIWFIKQFNVIFSAFPLIIIVIILSSFQLFIDFLKDDKLIMALLLTLFGWSKLAHILTEKVSEILTQDFIEGEIAIGKSKLEIAVQNVVPHMIPSLIVLFFLEIAMVLQLMAQIGIFGVLMSGGYSNADGDLNVPFEFDWASMLIFSYMFFGTDKVYLVLFPAVAFAVSIVAFNLFGEGLRLEFEKRTSRVITFIRRIPSYVSPFRFAYEIKNFSTYRKTVYTKVIAYGLVLLFLFFPQMPSPYKFDTAAAFGNIESLGGEQYGGRLAGSATNKQLAQYISSQLESYGLKPFDNSYIHQFDINRAINIKNSTLQVISSSSGTKEFEFRKDFIVNSPLTFSGTFEVASLDVGELYRISNDELEELKKKNWGNKLVMLNLYSTMNDRVRNNAVQILVNHIKPRAIIFTGAWDTAEDIRKNVVINKLFPNAAVISMSKEAGDELQRMGNAKVQLSVTADVYHDTAGYNVLAYIPGTDTNSSGDYIVIGSRMDYVGDDSSIRYPGSLEAGGIAAELEIAKKLAQSGIQPKKNILFAFWDGTFNEDRGSSYFVKKYTLQNKIASVMYIDIGNLGFKEDGTLLLDTSRVFPKNKEAQEYISILKKNAGRQDIKLSYGSINSPTMIDMAGKNIQSLMVSNYEKKLVSVTSKDTMEMLDKKRYRKMGQLLLDTIVEIARGN